jgi:hypothetical protein
MRRNEPGTCNITDAEVDQRLAIVRAAKAQVGRDLTPEELDALIPPVSCRRTRDRLKAAAGRAPQTRPLTPRRTAIMSVERVTAATREAVRTAVCHACGMPFAVDRRGEWKGTHAMVETIGRHDRCAVVLYYHTHCWARRHPLMPRPNGYGQNGRG